MFKIDDEPKTALEMLKNAGYEAYLVGGCVRDSVMGRKFNDYDITTSALPQETKDVFKDYKTIETGIKHGTVTVLINYFPLEITTFRIDGEYIDNRHPEEVTFSRNLKDDLSRRDFTVNALAYDGEIVDLFGGLDDIKNKIIRCVGDAETRFNEDGLRILRALRFASVLGFEIEEKTSKAILKNAHLLKNISKERVYSELSKMLCGKNVKYVIENYGAVFDALFLGDNFASSAASVGFIFNTLPLRLASFFLDDVYFVEDIKSLKPDNATFYRVCMAIENFDCEIPLDKASIKFYLREFGEQNFVDVCTLRRAEGEDVSEYIGIFNEIRENNECYSIPQLEANGADMSELGLRGKDIGEALNLLLDAVILGEVENEHDLLIKYTEENIIE